MERLPELLDIISLDDFKEKWGNNMVFLTDENAYQKWQAINTLFFEPTNIIEKSKNGLYNEIREIGLYNLYCIEEPNYFKSINLENLYTLHNNWISTLLHCCEKYMNDNHLEGLDFDIKHLIKKGGQTTSHDFELVLSIRNEEHTVKIEFKFSASGNSSIEQLAEFAAINTQSASGLILFGKDTYLDFFWDKGYIDRMCRAVGLEKPSNKTNWLKTAKSVAKPKEKYDGFHTALRDENISKNPDKKNIVNKSFCNFIKSKVDYMNYNKESIKEIFNIKQTDKYFCIFSSTAQQFSVQSIPNIVITQIIEKNPIDEFNHTFVIKTNGEHNIMCDMSWGNGGAGNQNPRVLFKLVGNIPEETISNKSKKKSGGSIEDGDEFDWLEMNEELAIDDSIGIEELKEIQGKSDNRGTNNNIGIRLRSGRILTTGGKLYKNIKNRTKKAKKNKKKYNKSKRRRRRSNF